MLTPRPATFSDCFTMADALRPADVAEVAAAGGINGITALCSGLRYSAAPMVGADDADIPVCMGGVVPTDDPLAGSVWMLATTELERHQMSFLRQCRRWVDQWNTQWPVLFNCVDERNELHIKWLRWLGFTFIRRHPEWGYERRPFLEFVRIQPCANP